MSEQLYYTSCESGLSGSVGFQFNATSSGIAADVMQFVESLSQYDPPDSLSGHVGDELVKSAPICLHYRPGDRSVLAQVVYVGKDFSGRYGNFFSHAIAGIDDTIDDGTLPIEYWASDFWATQPISTPQLPPIESRPPTGLITRSSVEGFLVGVPADRTAAIVSSAARSIATGERNVVILADQAKDVAMWIAATCYMLPPELARQLSFSTYSYKPSHIDANIIGTVSETHFDASERATDLYFFFDLQSGRRSEVETHRVVALASKVGVVDCQGLWELSAELQITDGAELDLWVEPVTVAAILTGVPTDREDLTVALSWVERNAGSIGAGRVTEFVAAAREHDEAIVDDLGSLVASAYDAGAERALEECELDIVAGQLEALEAGRVWNGPKTELRSESAQRQAVDHIELLLTSSSAASTARLLSYTVESGLDLNQQTLDAAGRMVLAPALLNRELSPSHALQHDGARDGIAEGLAEAAVTRPADVQSVLSEVAEPLGEDRLARYAVLTELATLAMIESGEISRVTALVELARIRERDEGHRPIGSDLIALIWSNDSMPFSDVVDATEALDDSQIQGGVLAGYISSAICNASEWNNEISRLVGLVRSRHLATSLSPDARNRLGEMERVVRQIDALPIADARHLDHVGQVLAELPRMSALPRSLALQRIASRLLAAGPRSIAHVLRTGPDVARAFCVASQRPLSEQDADLAARLWLARYELWRIQHPASRELEALLRSSLPNWKRRRIRKIGRQLDRRIPDGSARFKLWLASPNSTSQRRQTHG